MMFFFFTTCFITSAARFTELSRITTLSHHGSCLIQHALLTTLTLMFSKMT
jgi:hypothetical protein